MGQLFTIGYEGASLEDFIATLSAAGVTFLADIRDRAQSRKAGFSKTALSTAAEEAGIRYSHLRSLGDPKAGRDAARSGDWERFEEVYLAVLESDAGQAALRELCEIAEREEICLLCYEREPRFCHRSYVAREMESDLGCEVIHLGVQPLRVAAE